MFCKVDGKNQFDKDWVFYENTKKILIQYYQYFTQNQQMQIIKILVFLYQIKIYQEFQYFSNPNVGSQDRQVDYSVAQSYCRENNYGDAVQDFFNIAYYISVGKFTSIGKLQNDNKIVKQYSLCKDYYGQQEITQAEIFNEVYFLLKSKNKIQYQFENQNLEILDCQIYDENSDPYNTKHPDNKCVYYFLIFKQYDFDMSFSIDRQMQSILKNQGLVIKQYLTKLDSDSIHLKMKYDFAIQLFKQLDFLHQQDIVHGSIEPDNILVQSSMSIESIIQQNQSQYNQPNNQPVLNYCLSNYRFAQYQNQNIQSFNKNFSHPVLQLLNKSQLPALKQSDVFSLSLSILSILYYGEKIDYSQYDSLLNQFSFDSFGLILNKHVQNTEKDIYLIERDLQQGFEDLKNQLLDSNRNIQRNLESYAQSSDLESLLYYTLLEDINQIPSAKEILKILQKIQNRNSTLKILWQNKNYALSNFHYFKQFEEFVNSSCISIDIWNFDLNTKFSRRQNYNRCWDTGHHSPELKQQNTIEENSKYKYDSINIIGSDYTRQWEEAFIFYVYYKNSIQDFIHMNYFFYFEDQPQNGGYSYKRYIEYITFYTTNFTYKIFYNDFPSFIIDDTTAITRNMLNLFKGLKFFQDNFYVFMNISPFNVVQVSDLESLKNLDLKMIALPIFRVNSDLTELEQQKFFLYPLQNTNFYPYQADTYSLALTCIHIIMCLYTQKNDKYLFRNLLDSNLQLNSREDHIQEIKSQINQIFQQVFNRDLKEGFECDYETQFPDSLICLLYQQLDPDYLNIKDIGDIIERIEIIHNQQQNQQNYDFNRIII